ELAPRRFKRLKAQQRFGIARRQPHDHADAPHAIRLLLRINNRRPRRRAAESQDELAPPHSITSSARTSTLAGTSMPSALAVLRLMASVDLGGACPGRSAGFSPLRMRST